MDAGHSVKVPFAEEPNLPVAGSATLHYHHAYGLTFASETPLPLPPVERVAPAEPDVVIRHGEVAEYTHWEEGQLSHAAVSQTAAFLYWRGVVSCSIHNGKQVTLCDGPDTAPETLAMFVLGIVMGVLLHQRGFHVLHASAVLGGGGVLAFMGDSGQGKSTLAAAMTARGHALVADDTIAVPGEGEPLIYPGYPLLKLWPESAASLKEPLENYARLTPNEEKLGRSVADVFAREPAPLRALFLLANRTEISAEPLSAQEALMALVRNSYCVRSLPPEEMAANLQRCAALAAKVPVYRLSRPRDLGLLGEVCGCIESIGYCDYLLDVA